MTARSYTRNYTTLTDAITCFTDAMRDRLRAYGLFSEIISWKLRFFVPVDATGPEIIGKLLDRFPVERIGEREAA